MTDRVAIYGIKETLAELKTIDPKIQREALKSMRVAAAPVAAAVAAALPSSPPLSGMARGRAAYQPARAQKATTRTGGRKSSTSDESPLLKVYVPDGAAMMADMSGKRSGGSGSGATMIAALSARYGSASRFVYPAAEKAIPGVEAAVTRAADEAAKQVGQTLAYKGGRR